MREVLIRCPAFALALLVVVMVAGFGVLAGAQAKKPAAKKAAAKRVRVFFVEPKTGATVTSPAHLKFGSSGVEISPVPAIGYFWTTSAATRAGPWIR